MSPALTVNDQIYMRSCYTVLAAKASSIPGDVGSANGQHVGFGKLGFPVLDAFAVVASVFGEHVGDIIPLSAKEQVARTYAPSIIAAVEHAQPLWDWAVGPSPYHSVRGVGFPDPLGADSEPSVSVLVAGAFPLPAVVADTDFRPEADFGGGGGNGATHSLSYRAVGGL